MAGRLVVENEFGAGDGQERCDLLHDELGRLPESFREPLVLCYLEGLTQEQAAASFAARSGPSRAGSRAARQS